MAKKVVQQPFPDLSLPLSAETLGQAVRAQRVHAGLRLQDAAALAGVAKQTLQNIERGTDSVKLGTILKVLSSLGLTLFLSAPDDRDLEVRNNDDWI